jgi:hypothetical protein
MEEIIYYAVGGLLLVGLVLLLVRVKRWARQSTTEGLVETLRFAETFGLESLDANGQHLKGEVEGLPVSLSEGAIVSRAREGGMIGPERTLRIIVEAGTGEWLLFQRTLPERLVHPLPEVGEERELKEPRAAQRFLLRATEEPRFSADAVLLEALVDAELVLGRVAKGHTTLDFVPPVEFVGGLGGDVATLTRLLMASLAAAAPERARHFLGKESAYR